MIMDNELISKKKWYLIWRLPFIMHKILLSVFIILLFTGKIFGSEKSDNRENEEPSYINIKFSDSEEKYIEKYLKPKGVELSDVPKLWDLYRKHKIMAGIFLGFGIFFTAATQIATFGLILVLFFNVIIFASVIAVLVTSLAASIIFIVAAAINYWCAGQNKAISKKVRRAKRTMTLWDERDTFMNYSYNKIDFEILSINL